MAAWFTSLKTLSSTDRFPPLSKSLEESHGLPFHADMIRKGLTEQSCPVPSSAFRDLGFLRFRLKQRCHTAAGSHCVVPSHKRTTRSEWKSWLSTCLLGLTSPGPARELTHFRLRLLSDCVARGIFKGCSILVWGPSRFGVLLGIGGLYGFWLHLQL